MITWLAGVPGGPERTAIFLDSISRLVSYLDITGGGRLSRLWRERVLMKNKVDLFLDSGAFSAYTQGVTIDIDEYIALIKKYESRITVYANLDVIGDPIKTLKNQKYMEAAGLHPLPCFHYKEPIKYLKHYIDTYEYIAIGGMAAYGFSTKKRADWLDYLFHNFVCDATGMPKVRVHGYGMTSLKLMIRYPWYSVDSTSWVVSSRMGQVLVPRWKDNAYSYDDMSLKIQVSSRSPTMKIKGEHISTLNPNLKAYVLSYFKEKGYRLGKSTFKTEPEAYELKEDERWVGPKKDAKDGKRAVEIIVEPGVSNDYRLRDELDVIYFLDLQKSLPKWPWAFGGISSGFGLQ